VSGGIGCGRRNARKHQRQHEKERAESTSLPGGSHAEMLEATRLESLAQPLGA
jgi:hypothetical protein